MTETESAPIFDPFGIMQKNVKKYDSNRQLSQPMEQSAATSSTYQTRQPILLAVDDRKTVEGNFKTHNNKSGTSHHKQLFAESHAAYGPYANKAESPQSSSRTTNAGRFHSNLNVAERRQKQKQALQASASMDSSLDPFGIAALTSTGGASGREPVSLLDSMQPQSLEPRLEAACYDTSNPVPLDPKTGRPFSQSPANRNGAGSGSRALPPKMTIQLTLYEEVSAMALREEIAASQIAVEGSVYAQIKCSDALKNAPFTISASKTRQDMLIPQVKLRPNPKFTSLEPINKQISNRKECRPGEDNYEDGLDEAYLVQVPKSELGYIPIIHYSFSQVVEHMPVLLERKVTIQDTSCRIALQVRSKLTNRGDLKDFTLAVAMPEIVDGDSISIIRGEGAYDSLKRLVKFKLASLNKGESFMVSAQAKLWKAVRVDEVRFPVILRCSSSEDQISTVDFKIQEAEGSPCSISVTKAFSFRLLHRLT